MLFYRVIDDLLYFNDNERGLRLYIPISIEIEVFKLAYDEIKYLGYIRTYKRFTDSVYIYNITTKLYNFIRFYPNYRLN